VAARWRIRHKLLLGLGLAVVLMTLLLGGTLRGLWSYFITTNRIRNRLNEYVAAERVCSAINALVSDENLPNLVRPRDRKARKDGKAPLEENEYFQEAVQAIDAYSRELESNIEQSLSPSHGLFESGLVEVLRDKMEALRKDVGRRRGNELRGMAGDELVRAADLEFFKPAPPEGKELTAEQMDLPAFSLPRHADELRREVHKDLNERLTDTRRHYQWALWIVVPSSAIGLLLLFGLMRSFYAWVLTPIRDLETGVKKVTDGDLSQRIKLTSGDEMEGLAAAFNAMVERLEELYKDLNKQVHERSRQLVRSERLASVGFLAAGVAHEINNPLASIAFCSEALEARLLEIVDDGEREVFRKYLKMIQDEAFRCKSITGRLLEFSRTGEPKREMTELKPLVQAVLDVTRHLPHHRGKHITFEVPAGPPLSACVNAEEIKSVVLNLVVNALESMDDGGRLTIRLGQRGGQAELRFSDTGCGMTPEVIENIFEPFFTRSRTGKGTGLGLTISHLIITQHGGEIQARSAGPGHGSTFTVTLPIHAAEQSPAPAAPARRRAA
jgi:signal transduction histidine kinase